MKEGEYSEQIYSTSAENNNEIACITCGLKNKNIPFIDEHGPNYAKMIEEGYADEWCFAIRDLDSWTRQRSNKAKEHASEEEEQDRIFPCSSNAQELSSLRGVNGQQMYKKCRSVRGYLSPSSKYLAVLCMDDNGIPPSLWLLDLKRKTFEINAIGDDDPGKSDPSSTFHSADDVTTFGSKSNSLFESATQTSLISEVSPLLLHTQSQTRWVLYWMLVTV